MIKLNKIGTDESLKVIHEYKNDRKYSHFIESSNDISQNESIISNLSMKVDGMIKKVDSKRKKKIF